MIIGDWQYKLERPLAAGHHFQSYAAENRTDGKPVFVKIEHDPDRFGDGDFAWAHLRLWRSLAPVRINGVPRILDHGRKDGRIFLVTEWIKGEQLRSLVMRADPSKIAPDLLDTILDGCSRILDDIHAEGLLHGDISPGNIMVGGDGEVHLIDLAPPDPILHEGRDSIIGTAAYMSPSLKAGWNRTPEDDFFALKKVISDAADLLTSRVPPAACKDSLAQAVSRWRKYTGHISDIPATASSNWGAGTKPTFVGPAPTSTRSNWRRSTAITTIPLPQSDHHATTRADVVVFAPEHIKPEQHFFVELWVGPDGSADELVREATRSDRVVERSARQHIDLANDLLLTVALQLPGFEVTDPVQILGWNGDTSSLGFIVRAPKRLGTGPCPGIIKLIKDQIPFAAITFDIEVAQDEYAPTQNGRRDARIRRIEQAFASYAQQDRAEVLRRVQGMRATGTEVFVDVVSQRAGSAWQGALLRRIEESDGLFLFWSRHAARSTWVEMEWRHALDQHGIDFIHPVPLEDPRDVAPPTELAGKHFNDIFLPLILVEDSRRQT